MEADVAYLVTASVYAGFQLTIRFLVYPQMALVAEPSSWPRYEAGHQRRVVMLVGPLFAALVVCVVLLVVSGAEPAASLGAAALLVTLLVVTFVGAVPQHRVLTDHFDPQALRRLLAADTVRVLVALAQLVLAVAMLR
jgi:hypothetical protein